MATVITMPRINDTMTEGTVATWFKKVGDEIKQGDILAEIETDKASMELESSIDGTLLYIDVHEGETAPVDSLIAIIGKNNEDISELIENHKAYILENVIENYKLDIIHNESSKRNILISKVLTGILIFLVFPLYHLSFLGTPPRISEGFSINLIIGDLFIFLLVIAKIFIIFKLIYPFKSKLLFTNFKRGFHPIYHDNLGSNNDSFLLFGWLSILFSIFIIQTTDRDDVLIYVRFIFEFLGIIIGAWAIISRYKILNKIPIFFIKQNKLRMVVDYEDYLNKKIVDDEPHISFYQKLKAVIKKHPRTIEEKGTIEIINPETPGVPALVTKIKDENITNAISNGYELKVRALEMKDYGKLEIMIWLDNTSSNSNEY